MNESDTDSKSPEKYGKQPLVVGLTGGIGSGKTTVANGFGALGVPVIDADLLARELVEPGQPALDEIISAFGAAVISADQRLDRNYLRQVIYADPVQKTRLESILHPKIRQHIKALLAEIKTHYCIVVIPLLLETRQTDLVDRILVVDTPRKEQLARVAARDGLSDNAVMAIMNSQSERDTRLAAADDIIVNDQGISELIAHVRKLHDYYMGITHDH